LLNATAGAEDVVASSNATFQVTPKEGARCETTLAHGLRRANRLALAAATLALSASAMAIPVSFNFNSVTLGVANSNNASNGLGAKIGSSAAISNYMTGVLGSTVTVTGGDRDAFLQR
jgi:hypothetical protein